MNMTGIRNKPWLLNDYLKLGLYLLGLFAAYVTLPNNVWNPLTHEVVATLGVIGIWRYGWWFNHYARALIYENKVFPEQRRRADALWESGWRPRQIAFMLTTYKERKETTELVLQSIVRECNYLNVPAKIFVGTGDISDEVNLQNFLKGKRHKNTFEVIMIRQNQPGKRFAIGLVLRSMARNGINGDDPVVFMDGDSVLAPGCIPKCLPFFQLHDNLQALTTDENVTVYGPQWIQDWLEMRFAQRHLVMQSHSLSKKVLTLTGRMSVFRARNVVNIDFIRMVEADHLHHWLWGKFRFLSGDDKSTWYWLLKHKADMMYVPDALVHTIEHIEGNGFERMKQNFLRWSGNVLRNGARAIALGPNTVGWFIWWCLVDQRIAMWTTLIGPIGAIATSILVSPYFIIVYLVWVATTRLLQALILYRYVGKVDLSYPLLLFTNQVFNAIIKVYIVFRLPKQRWANRGDQKSFEGHALTLRIKEGVATGLTVFWVTALVMFVLHYLGLINFFAMH